MISLKKKYKWLLWRYTSARKKQNKIERVRQCLYKRKRQYNNSQATIPPPTSSPSSSQFFEATFGSSSLSLKLRLPEPNRKKGFAGEEIILSLTKHGWVKWLLQVLSEINDKYRCPDAGRVANYTSWQTQMFHPILLPPCSWQSLKYPNKQHPLLWAQAGQRQQRQGDLLWCS